MLSDVAKDAGSIRNFKRQSNSLADANCPRVLPRPDFFEVATRAESVVAQQLGERAVNRSLMSLVEATVGFAEASQPPEVPDAESHLSTASHVGCKVLNSAECLTLGFFEVRVVFDDGPPEVYHGVVESLERTDRLVVAH